MKSSEYNVKQGSEVWHSLRAGRVTSTRAKIVIEGNSIQKNKLLKELRSPEPEPRFDAEALKWGRYYEETAFSSYVIQTEVVRGWNLRPAGFFISDSYPSAGGSPDGIWEDISIGGEVIGGCEIKCPYNPDYHLKHLRWGLPREYQWQFFWLMWLTGADFWDFVSFDPRVDSENRLFVQRFFRDNNRMELIERKYAEFHHIYSSNEYYDEIPSAAELLASGCLADFLKR